MACEEERLALARTPSNSPQYDSAFGRWVMCIAGVTAARDGHASDWDEIMIERMNAWRELWETINGQIDLPWPDPETRSIEVRNKIFGDVKTAMIFSNSIEQAFRETGIELKDNETFACYVCVRERPDDVSEVISPTFWASHPEAVSPLGIILEPKTMQQMMEAIEQGKYEGAR